jgi:Protein of unknown function (DUF1118)
MAFNIDSVLSSLARNRILTKVRMLRNVINLYRSSPCCTSKLTAVHPIKLQTAQLGLLTRLENAGFTLTTASSLLIFADDNDLIGVLEASSDKVLPLIATGVDLAPSLLPLAAVALKTPPAVFFGGAAASAVAAAGAIFLIPDDSVLNIALQAAVAVPLGLLLPGGLTVGGVVLSKLK